MFWNKSTHQAIDEEVREFLMLPVHISGKDFNARLGVAEHITSPVKNFTAFRASLLAQRITESPHGFVPSNTDSYGWVGPGGSQLTVYPQGYGLRIAMRGRPGEIDELIVYLPRLFLDWNADLTVKVVPLNSHYEYIIHSLPRGESDWNVNIREEYVNNNSLGFKKDPTAPEWMWVSSDGGVVELSPELVGLQVTIYNIDESTAKKVLDYLQSGITMLTEISKV